MVDTLEDIDKPYREGDSDKVDRTVKWPTVEDATRRITVLIEGQTEGPEADIAARDLIVIMRELGRLTAERDAAVEALEGWKRNWQPTLDRLRELEAKDKL